MRNTKIFSHQILSLRLYKLSRNFWFHFFRHLGQVKKSAWAGCLHSNTKWYGRSLILLGISMSYLMIKRMFLIIFVTSDKDEIEISPEVGRKDRIQLRPISWIRSWDSITASRDYWGLTWVFFYSSKFIWWFFWVLLRICPSWKSTCPSWRKKWNLSKLRSTCPRWRKKWNQKPEHSLLTKCELGMIRFLEDEMWWIETKSGNRSGIIYPCRISKVWWLSSTSDKPVPVPNLLTGVNSGVSKYFAGK